MNTPYTPHLPTIVRARGYTAESRPDGRWNVKGRGMRRVVDVAELQSLLNPPRRVGMPRK